ncbi:MAG: hypothetical protein ACYSWY_07565 [Planctomycetota bacterium]
MGQVKSGKEDKELLTSRTNAVAQAGAGFKCLFKERTSFNTEVRWRYVSDPTTSEDVGINSIFFLFGVPYFY